MGKILVIAEKPSVAADYAKALNQFTSKDGYYEGDKYVITWAIGHIISRKELYEYDPNINRAPQNREHVLNTLPYFPEEHILKLALINPERYKNDKGKLAAIKKNNEGLIKREETIKQLFNRPDIDFVVNGCDAGREGEAIFCQIYDFLNCKLPVKRLWLSSNVAEDIVKGFNDLREGSEYFNLKQASYARAEMDWEHGLNLSALYASLYGAQLSVGRVQTPVLNMIVDREKEIKNFKPEDYYLLDAMFSTKDNSKYKGRLVIDESLKDITKEGRIVDVSKINSIISEIESKEGVIKSVEKVKKKELPKLLYNLSELQKEMSSKHKMPASEVLTIAQSLYETHKLTTYPRTSSQYLNTSMRDDVFKRLDFLPAEYDKEVAYAKESNCFLEKVLNDKKVEDHYALIPTTNAKNYDLSKLTKKENIVFTAIVKRFLAIFMPTHEYESTTITTTVSKYNFKTSGKKITQVGWKRLYTSNNTDNDDTEKDDDNNQDLTFEFSENMSILCDKAERISKKTQPPKRFTDGTLIGAMQLGGVKNSKIEDQDTLDMLKEKGLGTEATRAAIIENILGKGYVSRDKKAYLIPTDKGLDFIERIKVEAIKSPDITGEWEYKLKLVEKGQESKENLIREIRGFITNCVEEAKASYKEGDKISSGNTIDAICPLCGGKIVKSPKAYYCDNGHKGCKFVIFATICGKTLKDNDIKDICKKGTTKLIKGFTSINQKDENGKPRKFDACLVYSKEERKLKFGHPGGAKQPKERKQTDYTCPICGKPIMEFETGYGCSGFKDGCKFSFFKSFFNVQLSPADINNLLSKGETDVFKDICNPKYPNRKFSAKLKINNNAVEAVFMNENNEEDTGKPTSHFCPCCNNTIEEFSRYYKCRKCNFIINKVIAGVTLKDEHIKDICLNKKTTEYIEFISNANKPFKARLVLNNKSKKLEFQLFTEESKYKCPLCKSAIGDTGKTYKCTNNKCNLTVWKTIAGLTLNDDILGELFKNKSTLDYLELTSSKGNPFKAKIVINPKTKKVEFDFAPKS